MASKEKTKEKIEEQDQQKTEKQEEVQVAEAKAETEAPKAAETKAGEKVVSVEALAEAAEEAVEEVLEPIEKSEEELVIEAAKRLEKAREERLAAWQPKTKLGLEVKEGKIKDIDEVLTSGRKIMEAAVVDKLVSLSSDLLYIGQSKGKFGGGKKRAWRQTQRKTAEGNRSSFACMTVVGDRAGHVGIGYGKSKETLPAREKAEREAKINLIKVKRGCGSFDCSCNEPHSIPYKSEGKCGSSKIILMPAPKGTGLAIEDECKKILAFAGIKDIYSKTFGQTRTKINLTKACFAALKKLETMKRQEK